MPERKVGACAPCLLSGMRKRSTNSSAARTERVSRDGRSRRLPRGRTGEDALPVPRGSPVAIDDVPVLGTDADIIRITEIHRFDAVALLPSDRCSCARMRKLDQVLEDTGVDLLIAPVLIDIVGPRLHISPLAGLPLLQMSAPRYSGPARVVKRIVDRILALVAPWRQKRTDRTESNRAGKGFEHV